MVEKKLPETLVKIIRNEVKNGKTKIKVALEFGISYYIIKKLTKDIPTVLRISDELEQKIRNRVRQGKSIREIKEELSVSRDTVIKYTRDIPKHWKKPRRTQDEIQQIRKNVRKYNSKLKTTKIMNLPYSTVRNHTTDITIKRGLTEAQIKKIREETLNCKSKIQIAQENKVSYGLVLKHTRDLPSRFQLGGYHGIRGKTLEILKKLLIDGYYICSASGDTTKCRNLKKHFPMLLKAYCCGKTVIYLQDKSNEAAKGIIGLSNKKVLSYQEIKQIIKVFL